MVYGLEFVCVLQREAQPAFFFLGAAHAAVERRRAAQRARELRLAGAAAAVPAVVPGAYVGQFLAVEGARRLSEEEFLHFLEVHRIFCWAHVMTGRLI